MDYDPAALKAEIPQMEESIRLFEGKTAEMRDRITQYKIWIAQSEASENAET